MYSHRTTLLRSVIAGLVLGLIGGTLVSAQGGLSNQVLQLLTRSPNTWTGTNYYQDLRVPFAAIPATTTARIYSDLAGNLYYNGFLVAGVGGVTIPHNLLSTTHPDTVPAGATQGAIIVGNATPAWARLQPTVAAFVAFNGTNTVFTTDGSAFTVLPAASLTGTLPAISGVNLTALNATSLGSGTVPLARLSGITTTQLAAAAGILRTQLSIAGGIVLTTDVTGVLPIANGGTGLAAAADSTVLLSNAGVLVATAVPNCVSGTTALAYTSATHTISCQALTTGSGTVTSVGLSLPAIFTVTGSPISTAGTLSASLATETANLVWAGPTTGAAAAPTFRALVNADLPLSGVGAGTYPKVTVNTAGVVTAASAQITLTTDVTGILPMANGGTGVGVSAANTVLVGNAGATAWAALTLPDTTTGFLSYNATTHLFSLGQVIPIGTITASTPIGWSETWNNGAITFNAFSIAVTNTASAAASTLVNWTVGGTSVFAVDYAGSETLAAGGLLKWTGRSRVGATADNLFQISDSANARHVEASASAVTIGSGFGTTPSVLGTASSFAVTVGTPSGTNTGVIAFTTAWTNAPACIADDETTIAANPITCVETTGQVTLLGTLPFTAADKIHVICLGY